MSAACSGSTPPRVLVQVCEAPAYRPVDLLIACADGNARVAKLRWTTWTAQRATGTGSWEENDCKPFCAEGTFHDYPVRLDLSEPMTKGRGKVFGRVVATFPRSTPTAPAFGQNPFVVMDHGVEP